MGLRCHRSGSIVSGQPPDPNRIRIYGNAAFSSNNSSIRLLGQAGNFSRVSFSQAEDPSHSVWRFPEDSEWLPPVSPHALSLRTTSSFSQSRWVESSSLSRCPCIFTPNGSDRAPAMQGNPPPLCRRPIYRPINRAIGGRQADDNNA